MFSIIHIINNSRTAIMLTASYDHPKYSKCVKKFPVVNLLTLLPLNVICGIQLLDYRRRYSGLKEFEIYPITAYARAKKRNGNNS